MEQKTKTLELKEKIVNGLKAGAEKVKDFYDDNREEIGCVIFYGGMTILFGQSMLYMHALTRAIRKNT